MARLAAIAFAVTIGIVCASCSSSGGDAAARSPTAAAAFGDTVTPVRFATTDVTYPRSGGVGTLHVEVASTPAQSERGLGYRDALADDAGMLFDLHETFVPQFWMKGMRFPLDFVWIGEDKRVVATSKAVPAQPGLPDADLVLVSAPAAVRYVLEVNSGAADRLGLETGAQLAFELRP
jgi:uncharacterized membrane protein (UPF0127 family)